MIILKNYRKPEKSSSKKKLSEDNKKQITYSDSWCLKTFVTSISSIFMVVPDIPFVPSVSEISIPVTMSRKYSMFKTSNPNTVINLEFKCVKKAQFG